MGIGNRLHGMASKLRRRIIFALSVVTSMAGGCRREIVLGCRFVI